MQVYSVFGEKKGLVVNISVNVPVSRLLRGRQKESSGHMVTLGWWLWLLCCASSGPQGQCRWPGKRPNALSPCASRDQQCSSFPLCSFWGMGRSGREDGVCLLEGDDVCWWTDVLKGHSARVSKLSSEPGPVAGHQSGGSSFVSPACVARGFINVHSAPRSPYWFTQTSKKGKVYYRLL